MAAHVVGGLQPLDPSTLGNAKVSRLCRNSEGYETHVILPVETGLSQVSVIWSTIDLKSKGDVALSVRNSRPC